jgi:hypothetical protein
METPTSITPAATFSMQSESIVNVVTALCAALPDMPAVERKHKARIKSTKGADSSYEYSYADLSDILAATSLPMAKHGLVVTWSSQPDERGPVVGTLWHVSGEWMRAGMLIPPMSNPQERGSMLSYLKRYLFGLLVPIAATEADDDGQRAAHGQDDDAIAQAAILDAKRKDREAIAAEGKASGRYKRVAKIEDEKALADAGLVPVQPTTAEPPPPVNAPPPPPEPDGELHLTPPPQVPSHIHSLVYALEADGIPVEKFVQWATNPRPAVGTTPAKGRLLPEGTKLENFAPDWVATIMKPGSWAKVTEQLK